jgi:hypothetical protein
VEERKYMTLHANAKHSQLFTLRVWPEELSEGRVEWRGKIQRVLDGETLYFRGWDAMMAFLLQTLEIGTPAADEDNQRREIHE